MAIGEEAINEIAVELIKLEEQKHRIKAEESDLNKAIASTRSKLYQSMEDTGVDEISVDGIKFKQTEETSYAMSDPSLPKWDDNPAWHEWLKANDLDGIIKTVVSTNAATRKKTLKEFADGGGELPKFIKESFFNTVKYSDAAVKRRVSET